MASPDEARVDEARDQSTIPAAPSDPTPRTDPLRVILRRSAARPRTAAHRPLAS